MYFIRKELRDFSIAHRLIKGYQGKCANLHGHNYSCVVTISAQDVDHYGFVIDFNHVKTLFDDWVDAEIDHHLLI